MPQPYKSGRQQNLNLGISSVTENNTVLQTIGKVGIGTTNAKNHSLFVVGSANINGDLSVTGIVTATSFSGDISAGVATFIDLTATNATLTNINSSGIATVTQLETQRTFTSGVTTSVGGFVGNLTGTATTATKLETARTFEITGDIVASPIAFDGTGNVSLAATIQPNSVGLGTDTFGDYVKDISGTSNQIDVTGGTGEGSTPVISFAPNPTIGGNVTIGNDLQVNNNLNVTGNITVGGTAGYILVENFRVTDADIILGFTTDSNGNDVSTDITANHGGIAIASTEGNPLVNLNIAGIETLPPTYKKIMWFKAGSFAGLNTDAWLSNYAIGIGSTQFPLGTRLAAGSVQFTENDLAVVRNINASGIVTAFGGFVGNLIGAASTASFATTAFSLNGVAEGNLSVGFARTAGIATNLKGGIGGNVPYQSAADTTTFVTNGLSGQVLLFNGSVPIWGNVSAASGAFGGITVYDEGNLVGTAGSIVALNFVSPNITVTGTSGANGIATVRLADNLVGTALSISGISTFNGNVSVGSGITMYPSTGIVSAVAFYGSGVNLTDLILAKIEGIQVQEEGVNVGTGLTFATLNFVGNYVTATGVGTTATITFTTPPYALVAGIATYASVAGIATYASVAGIATYASVAGFSTLSGYSDTSGIATYASTAGIATYASVAGIATYASIAGISTYASTAGIATYASISGVSTNVIGGIASVTQLNVSGISTLGVTSTTNLTTQQLNVSGVSTFTGIGTFGNNLYVGGNVSIVGVLTAERLYSNVYGEFTGGGISGTNIVGTALSISGISTLGVTSTTNLTTQQLNVSGVSTFAGITTVTGATLFAKQLNVSGISTIGNFRITPVGTGATVGGSSGIVTYYGDGSQLLGVVSPESNGEFYTGVSSSIQLTPLSYETSIYTFPSTAGKQYVIESINVANVDTSVGVGTTVNIIASIENSTGEQTYIAYNVPITDGGLIELLKNPIVAGPSDVMKMWSTNDAYVGVNSSTEVYMNYTEFTSTEYISEYASTVSIATTDPTAVYTSTTYPSVIEAIHFANRTDVGDYPISVSITNGTTTTFLAKNLIIPRYATVDILDRPKRIETNGVIKVSVAQTSTIDVIIAGKQIT